MELYELRQAFVDVQEAAMNADGDDAELFEAALADLREQINVKSDEQLVDAVDDAAKVVRNSIARIDALRAEEKRLATKRKTIEARKARWIEWAHALMIDANTRKVHTPVFTVSIQKNAPAVDVRDEAAVPEEWKIPQPAKLNKRDALAALKDGTEIPGLELRRSESLRIR